MIRVIRYPPLQNSLHKYPLSQRKDEGCPLTSTFVNREFEQFDARSNLTSQNDLRFLSQELQPDSVAKLRATPLILICSPTMFSYAARQLRIGDCAAEKPSASTGSPHGVRAATISKTEWPKVPATRF